MLSDFAEKKKPLLALRNRIFQSPKNLCFWLKKMPFLVKIRLKIMLNYFGEKKETFFEYKK